MSMAAWWGDRCVGFEDVGFCHVMRGESWAEEGYLLFLSELRRAVLHGAAVLALSGCNSGNDRLGINSSQRPDALVV